MSDAALKPRTIEAQALRAGVLLPLPLGGVYDYSLDEALPRGAVVAAPLGSRMVLGVVWSEADG
ncbi:MAG TPA: hypothetical protein VIY09_07865, partial [Rhizomicrobium sp.]